MTTAALTVYADYAASPLGDVYATVYAHGHGTREVHGADLLACQAAVMDAVHDIADAARRPCSTVHTLNGDAQAFTAAYIRAGGVSADQGWQSMDDL